MDVRTEDRVHAADLETAGNGSVIAVDDTDVPYCVRLDSGDVRWYRASEVTPLNAEPATYTVPQLHAINAALALLEFEKDNDDSLHREIRSDVLGRTRERTHDLLDALDPGWSKR